MKDLVIPAMGLLWACPLHCTITHIIEVVVHYNHTQNAFYSVKPDKS